MVDLPPPDFSAIDFPSDTLSFKTLRRLYPEHFDTTDTGMLMALLKETNGNPILHIIDMIHTERELAELVYHHTDKTPGKYGKEARKWAKEEIRLMKKMLTERYTRFEIASGPFAAAELITSITSQAAEQARSVLGRQV